MTWFVTSLLLLACISGGNGAETAETSLSELDEQQQKMADQIQMIHKAVITLKTAMKTLLEKGVVFDLSGTEEDIAAMELDMMKQLFGGTWNTTGQPSTEEDIAAMELDMMKQLFGDTGNTTGQPNSVENVAAMELDMMKQLLAGAGNTTGQPNSDSGDTTGDNMFSQLFANAMKQQGGNRATDSTKNDGQTAGDDAQPPRTSTEATSDFGSMFGGGFQSFKASSLNFFK